MARGPEGKRRASLAQGQLSQLSWGSKQPVQVQGGAGPSDIGTGRLDFLGRAHSLIPGPRLPYLPGCGLGLEPEARALGPSLGAEGPLQAMNPGMKSREQGELRQRGCE